jgi:hypothetical protein
MQNLKSATEMRALNDSGFGMKAPVQQKMSAGPQRQMHALPAEGRNMDRRAQEPVSRVPTGNSGNYGDRLMAMQARMPQGNRAQPNGEKSLRSEY